MSALALVLSVVAGVIAAADESASDMPRLKIQQPVLDDGGLVIPFVGPAAPFERSERRIARGKLVIFTPGLTARASNHSFSEGPLKSLQIRPVRYGVAFWLEPRTSVALLSEHITLPSPGSPSLRIGPADTDAPTALAQAEPTSTRAAPNAHVERKALVPAPVAATGPVSMAHANESAAPARPVETASPTTLAPPPERSSTLLWATLGLVMAAVAALAWVHQRRRSTAGAGQLIDVVAIRAFGPKHQIAVVEAYGDRLLIAASDAGVQLLSRVGAGRTVALSPTNHETSGAAATRSFADELTAATRSTVVPTAVPTEVPADLRGLVRLRTATQSQQSPELKAFAGGLLQ